MTGDAGEQVASKRRHVAATFAERRNGDLDDREPVIEVLAEMPRRDLIEQRAVGGGDDADVDLTRMPTAERVDLARLQQAQQLDLRIERQLADLVEHQRAAVGIDALAGRARKCTGERALFMPEEFGLGSGWRGWCRN